VMVGVGVGMRLVDDRFAPPFRHSDEALDSLARKHVIGWWMFHVLNGLYIIDEIRIVLQQIS
jgi:hypothetical protein